jgi:hypothetical protein
MELSPFEQQAITYAHNFNWPDTDDWEEERNILLNDFKTHVNDLKDLEEGMMPTQETPEIPRRVPTLTSNDRAVSQK